MDHPIGKPVPRKEGRKKVTGQALYIDDLSYPDMLHAVTVRSPAARGKITNITFGGDIPWDEFTIVTAKDIPGANYVALILNDQPYLADGFVNHPEEPVVLLAHPDKYLLEEARRNVALEIEPPIHSQKSRSSGAKTTSSKSFLSTKAMWTTPGRTLISSLKANTKRARRNNSTSRTTARSRSLMRLTA
jgi:xanthine dehydrogenase molybdopterin-binding subunit B